MSRIISSPVTMIRRTSETEKSVFNEHRSELYDSPGDDESFWFFIHIECLLKNTGVGTLRSSDIVDSFDADTPERTKCPCQEMVEQVDDAFHARIVRSNTKIEFFAESIRDEQNLCSPVYKMSGREAMWMGSTDFRDRNTTAGCRIRSINPKK